MAGRLYNSMEFCVAVVLRIQSYIVWQFASQLAFAIFISNSKMLKGTFGKYPQVPKCYEHDCKFQKWNSWVMVILILTKYILF